DIQNEHVEMDLATLDRINARKTGALFKAAVIAGGQYLQMDEKKLAQLEIYAECTGKAYQIVDDLLDVEGDREKIGKNIGHDAQTGKKTYPALCGLDQSRNKVAELYEQAMAALEESGCQSPFLKELTHFLFYRDY
ncbi:MAG TPA: hypothetical protein DHN33_00510, partial [Eubacteriaceae bacterium]|nr:hypothetical protein [Eubacteriaceae bacterium]